LQGEGQARLSLGQGPAATQVEPIHPWKNASAIARYREVIHMKPESAGARKLGLALAQKGDLDSAIPLWREATRLNPDYPEAHYNLGLALAKKGDPQGALEEYRAAYQLAPENPAVKAHYERLCGQLGA